MQMLAPAQPQQQGNAEVFGSPIVGGKLGNGPGVGMSGAGTQMNFMGKGAAAIAMLRYPDLVAYSQG